MQEEVIRETPYYGSLERLHHLPMLAVPRMKLVLVNPCWNGVKIS